MIRGVEAMIPIARYCRIEMEGGVFVVGARWTGWADLGFVYFGRSFFEGRIQHLESWNTIYMQL